MRAYKALFVCLLLMPFAALEDINSYNVDLSDFEDDTDDEFDEGYGPQDEALYDESAEERYMDELDRSGKKNFNMKNPGSCSGQSCSVTCAGGGDQMKKLAAGESFTMCSPGYPNKYPKGARCVVDVEAPPFAWLKVTFCYFNIVYSPMCKGDRLVVLDRAMSSSGVDPPCENKYQRSRRFCNIQTKRVYYVKTPNARFKFQTNKDRYIRKGFRMSIQAIKSPCALELMPPKGVVHVSHMKGNRYHSNYYCNWAYNYGHTENEAFQITCPKFYVSEGVKYMHSSPDCFHIQTSVNGSVGSEFSYTGKNGPSYLSHGGNVTFEFFANRRHHSKGFTCQYQINPPGGLDGLCIHAKNCNSSRLMCVDQHCKCTSNYTQVNVKGVEMCAQAMNVGDSGCTSDADCVLGDANAFCDMGQCACQNGFAEMGGKCYPEAKLGESCIASEQCVLTLNAGLCGTSGKCECSSGFSTNRGCGGNKYQGCYPIVIVAAGVTTAKFKMPVSHNARFCVYNFVYGFILFESPKWKKAIKYDFKRTGRKIKNNLKVYKKVNNKWSYGHQRTYKTLVKDNPDNFWLMRFGINQQLRTGNGKGIISPNIHVGPPVKWEYVSLSSASRRQARYIIFIEPSS